MTYSTLVNNNLVYVRFCIGATIRTRWQVQCLPYAEFFFTVTYSTLVNLVSVHFGIGATIHTRRELQCLPYDGYFFYSDLLYSG